MGEVCADISTIVERLVRKTLSNGRNSDLAAVIGSGMGRLVTSHMNVMGLSVNKSAGAVLYGLSALMSMLALALSSRSGSNDPTALTPDASARQPQPDQGLGWSAQHRVSRYLENQKEHLLDRARNSRHLVLKRLASRVEWQISRHKRIEGDALPAVCRQSHCDYMWNNLHQYGVCTRVLMVTGHTLFQITNRLFISWDKYAARLLNQTVLKRFTGELLGHRLSSCLMYAASAGLSIPASQLIVGLSTLGAAVCAATLVCFLMAKLAVALGDWKGNLQPTPKRRPVFHGS
ncbi:hypothetical protein NQT62_06575 [Limnobacter humi]|uniref:DUF697 domain-containing protein n=1 Tax=Limnobacter humi TaxID=1778671 RepID=A0ABT1WF07_9BURK|nr:hypothetical protein [Limnobacter humi]MCQ8896100.1 hypothetical protein [Limnobacter humi]